MNSSITKLTLLALLSCNFLQAIEINFEAEFAKVEKSIPLDASLPRHERYAQYLFFYAMDCCAVDNGVDTETAKKACSEMLTIKNLSSEMRSVALDLLANIYAGIEHNYAQAIECLDQILTLADLDNYTLKLIQLNKEQYELLNQDKKIDEQAYQKRLAEIADEAEEELKCMQCKSNNN